MESIIDITSFSARSCLNQLCLKPNDVMLIASNFYQSQDRSQYLQESAKSQVIREDWIHSSIERQHKVVSRPLVEPLIDCLSVPLTIAAVEGSGRSRVNPLKI